MTKTILITDDSESLRDIIAKIIELKSYTVIQAKDGVDGIKKFNTNQIDLIVTDLYMPIMDGINFIKEIRLINTDVPIIVLSTESSIDKKKEAMKAGANGWIEKPFSPSKLLNMIEKISEIS